MIFVINDARLGVRSMDTDNFELPAAKNQGLKDLEIMSIEALYEYVDELQREIERATNQISLKKSHRNAADSFFERPSE